MLILRIIIIFLKMKNFLQKHIQRSILLQLPNHKYSNVLQSVILFYKIFTFLTFDQTVRLTNIKLSYTQASIYHFTFTRSFYSLSVCFTCRQ